MLHRSENHPFHPLRIYHRGTNVKHIVLIASTPSADIGVVGHDSVNDEWAVWMLDETCRAQLPLSKTTDADTAPLGLALDYSASETIPSLNPDMDDTSIPPVPIFLFLNNEGMIGAYHCLNVEAIKNGESFSGMLKAIEVPMEEIDNAHGASTSEPAKSLLPKLKPITTSVTTSQSTSFDGFGIATALGGFETSESSFISRPPSPTKATPPMFERPASPIKSTPLAFARPPSPTKSVAPSFPRLPITPVVSKATDTTSNDTEIPTSGSKLVGTKPTTGFFRSDTTASKAGPFTNTSISTFGGSSSLGVSSPSTNFGASSISATIPNDSKQALASTLSLSLSKTTTAEPPKTLNDKSLISTPPTLTETVKPIVGYVIGSGNTSTKKAEIPPLAKASTSTSSMVPAPTFSSVTKSAEPKPVVAATSNLGKTGHKLGAGQPQTSNLMQNAPVIKQQKQTMEEVRTFFWLTIRLYFAPFRQSKPLGHECRVYFYSIWQQTRHKDLRFPLSNIWLFLILGHLERIRIGLPSPIWWTKLGRYSSISSLFWILFIILDVLKVYQIYILKPAPSELRKFYAIPWEPSSGNGI